MNKQLLEATQSPVSWEVAGIQHEIFLRVLAGLRHELVGPISVSRMAISVLKRTLEKGDPGKEAIQQQVARMDEQMQQSVLGIRALSLWDEDNNALGPVNDIIRHGLKLMAYRLSMRGITVDDDEIAAIDGIESSETDSDQVPHQAFLYTWLGLLAHVEDYHYPATLKVSPEQPAMLSIKLTVGKAQGLLSEVKPNHHHIDQQSLSALADHCGVSLKFTRDQISLGWKKASI